MILNLGYGSKNYRIDLLLMKQKKKTKPLAVLQNFEKKVYLVVLWQ